MLWHILVKSNEQVICHWYGSRSVGDAIAVVRLNSKSKGIAYLMYVYMYIDRGTYLVRYSDQQNLQERISLQSTALPVFIFVILVLKLSYYHYLKTSFYSTTIAHNPDVSIIRTKWQFPWWKYTGLQLRDSRHPLAAAIYTCKQGPDSMLLHCEHMQC